MPSPLTRSDILKSLFPDDPIARIGKHPYFYRYLRKHNIGTRQFANHSGIGMTTVQKILNLQWYPEDWNHKSTSFILDKLMKYLNINPFYLFPPDFVDKLCILKLASEHKEETVSEDPEIFEYLSPSRAADIPRMIHFSQALENMESSPIPLLKEKELKYVFEDLIEMEGSRKALNHYRRFLYAHFHWLWSRSPD